MAISCRKVRDDRQYSEQVEGYLLKHAELSLLPRVVSAVCGEGDQPDRTRTGEEA